MISHTKEKIVNFPLILYIQGNIAEVVKRGAHEPPFRIGAPLFEIDSFEDNDYLQSCQFRIEVHIF